MKNNNNQEDQIDNDATRDHALLRARSRVGAIRAARGGQPSGRGGQLAPLVISSPPEQVPDNPFSDRFASTGGAENASILSGGGSMLGTQLGARPLFIVGSNETLMQSQALFHLGNDPGLQQQQLAASTGGHAPSQASLFSSSGVGGIDASRTAGLLSGTLRSPRTHEKRRPNGSLAPRTTGGGNSGGGTAIALTGGAAPGEMQGTLAPASTTALGAHGIGTSTASLFAPPPNSLSAIRKRKPASQAQLGPSPIAAAIGDLVADPDEVSRGLSAKSGSGQPRSSRRWAKLSRSPIEVDELEALLKTSRPTVHASPGTLPSHDEDAFSSPSEQGTVLRRPWIPTSSKPPAMWEPWRAHTVSSTSSSLALTAKDSWAAVQSLGVVVPSLSRQARAGHDVATRRFNASIAASSPYLYGPLTMDVSAPLIVPRHTQQQLKSDYELPPDPATQTVLHYPTIVCRPGTSALVVGTEPQLRCLRITVSHVELTAHPQFTSEHKAAAALVSAAEVYAARRAIRADLRQSATVRAKIAEYRRAKRALAEETANPTSPISASGPTQSPLVAKVRSGSGPVTAGGAEQQQQRQEQHAAKDRALHRLANGLVMLEALCAVRTARIERARERRALVSARDAVQAAWDRLVLIRQETAPHSAVHATSERLTLAESGGTGLDRDPGAASTTEDEARSLERENHEWGIAVALVQELALAVCGGNTESALALIPELAAYTPDPADTGAPLQLPAYRIERDPIAAQHQLDKFVPSLPLTRLVGPPLLVTVSVGGLGVATTRPAHVRERIIAFLESFDVMVDTTATSFVSLQICESGFIHARSTLATLYISLDTHSSAESGHRLSFATASGDLAGDLMCRLVWQKHTLLPSTTARRRRPWDMSTVAESFPLLHSLPNPLGLSLHGLVDWATRLRDAVPAHHPLAAYVNALALDSRVLLFEATPPAPPPPRHTTEPLTEAAEPVVINEEYDDPEALGDFSPLERRWHSILSMRYRKQIVGVGPVMLDEHIMTTSYQEAQPPSKELQVLLQNKNELGAGKFAALARRLHVRQLHAKGALAREQEFDQLVREIQLPQQVQESNFLLDLLRPRRPLRPQKDTPKWELKGNVTAAAAAAALARPAIDAGEYVVIVQVKRGFNFPSRVPSSDETVGSGGGGGSGMAAANAGLGGGAMSPSPLSPLGGGGGGGPLRYGLGGSGASPGGAGQSPLLPTDLAAAIPGLADTGATADSTTQLFVQVEFGRNRAQTAAVRGPHPEWNAAVEVPVRILSEDAIPNGTIHINIFDEVHVNLPVDDRMRDRSVHYIKESRWIGSVQVPMVSLCEQGKISGRFQVTVAAPLFGYVRPDKMVNGGSTSMTPSLDNGLNLGNGRPPTLDGRSRGGDESNTAAAAQFGFVAAAGAHPGGLLPLLVADAPMLDLVLSLDPPLARTSQLQLTGSTSANFEEERIHEHAVRWHACLPSPKSRFALALVTDLNGSRVHVARYLRPMAPPPYVKHADQAIRFVSLIPTLSDRLSFAADVHIWAACDQFLALGAGDGIDHAILLANYLLYLGYEAYLVLGKCVPEGATAHVMYFPLKSSSSDSLPGKLDTLDPIASPHQQRYPKKSNKSGFPAAVASPIFVNSLAGHSYAAHSRLAATLGLTGIGCVIGPNNAWLNQQRVDDAATVPGMQWDLTRVDCWRPFFSQQQASPPSPSMASGIPRSLPWTSVQLDRVEYTRVPAKSVKNLQLQLEAAITRGIETWRRLPTRWNRLLCRVLARLAAAQEVHGDPDATMASGGHQQMHVAAMAELQKVAAVQGQQLYAIAVHQPWTDEATLVDAVHATRIWETDDPTVEHAVAVHCVGLYNGIVSVWVAMACCSRQWGQLSLGFVRSPSSIFGGATGPGGGGMRRPSSSGGGGTVRSGGTVVRNPSMVGSVASAATVPATIADLVLDQTGAAGSGGDDLFGLAASSPSAGGGTSRRRRASSSHTRSPSADTTPIVAEAAAVVATGMSRKRTLSFETRSSLRTSATAGNLDEVAERGA
ncbi:hypothetical protein BC828DRAFT_392320 [Blastocladiella britannica]|nr:hypothetical protein BC828DRAFT_392320 [Blastocladiella britannica]